MNQTLAKPTPTLPGGRFFGAVEGRWHTELVKLSLVHHADARSVPMHSHEDMFLSLLLRGRYCEWVDGQAIEYEPLTVVFHPERCEHRDEIKAPGSLFFAVVARPELLGGHERRHRALRSVRDLRGGPTVWAMLRLLETLRREPPEALLCEEPVGEIVDELLGRPQPSAIRPRWLARVEERLQAEYRSPVSLGALATSAGVHPVHLSRVFRRHHGGSIRAFVHQLRVLHACRLIAGDCCSLAEAALESGFCDQSHMTRVFVGVAGMTPSAYRRAARS